MIQTIMANDNNIDTKPIQDAFERMARSIRNQEQASYKLADAMDKLGEAGVKDLTEKIKQAAKQSKIFTDAQLKLIKTSRDLEDGVRQQEKELDERLVVEKELRESIKQSIKALRENTSLFKDELEAAKEDLRVKLDERNQIRQEIKDRKDNMASFAANTDILIKNSDSIKVWNNYVNKGTDALKGWAASNLTGKKSFELLKGASLQFVDELNKATAVGLQDSFFTIGKEAVGLRMSFDEFSSIIAKNRDIVRQLGDGSVGISKFQTVLKDASAGLAYMGKDGTIATARFIESMKTMGITVKDTDQFGITMAKTQKKFTRWSATYGDTAESFADVTESQMKSSSVQAQMIGLLPKQRDALREEIMARIENSKNLGLSNEQIKDFSDRLEHTLDPHKIDIPATIKQAASSATHFRLLAERDPNNKVLQDAVAAMVNANEELMKNPMMGAEAFKKSITDIQPELLQEIGKAEARTTAGTKNQSEMGANVGLGITEHAGGAIMESQLKYAGDSAVAFAANLNQTSASAEKRGDIAEELTKNQSLAVKTVADLRDGLQIYNAYMQNAGVQALIGLGAGIGAVLTKLGLFDAALVFSSGMLMKKGLELGGSGGGGSGGKGGGGKGNMLGKIAGSALSLGYGAYEGYNTHEDYNAGKISEKDRNKGYGKAGGAALGGIIGGMAGAGIMSIPLGMAGSYIGGELGEMAGGFYPTSTKINSSPDVAAHAEQAAAAAVVSTEASQSQSIPVEKSNNVIEELKKHTYILEQISRNTIAFKGGNPDMYKSTAARVATNAFSG